MEHVFDSVCRCFGGVPATATSSRREAARSSNPSSPRRVKTNQSPEIKRRTSRLELQDKEWDGLFQHDNKQQQQQQHSSKPLQYHHAPENPDLEYARAVAQAKLAGANPTRRSPKSRSASTNKRKTPASKRDEIFRTRRFEPPQKTCSTQENPTNHLTRLLSNHPVVANALCFANPVRDEDEDDLPLNQEPDDDSTLNTCEDTMTSTVYFDAKYAHVVEKRPPMPLFSHFKVNEEEDHIRRIVATDSHNSLNMIRLFNENKANASLEETSSDEDQERPTPPPKIDRTNVLQHAIPRRHSPPPDPVKMSSSGSSKSTASTTPSSSSPPFADEGRVVHRL